MYGLSIIGSVADPFFYAFLGFHIDFNLNNADSAITYRRSLWITKN